MDNSSIDLHPPFFGAAILAMAGEERLSPRKVLGLVAGLAGIVVLKGASTLDLCGQSLGILLCLVAAASYGLSSLWAKKRLAGIAPLTLATAQLMCSSVVMSVVAFAFDDPLSLLHASPVTWGALLGLALLATALAYFVFFIVIARSGPANVLLVTMLIPVSAIVMGYLVLGETLELREIIGALIIILALAVIDGRALQWLKPSRTGDHPA